MGKMSNGEKSQDQHFVDFGVVTLSQTVNCYLLQIGVLAMIRL